MKAKQLLLDGILLGYVFSLILVGIIFATGPSTVSGMAILSQEYLLENFSTPLRWIAGLMVLGVGSAVLLRHFKIETVGSRLFATPKGSEAKVQPVWFRSFSGWQLVITVLGTLIVSVYQTQFSLTELLDADGFAGAQRLFSGLASPDFSILPEAILEILETIFIAFLATAMAIPLAFLLAFFCAKNIMQSPLAFALYGLLRTSLNVMRSIEPLIWAIIFSVWVGIGPFSGMLALMIHSIASLAKQYSEIIESVSEGPIEGVRSTGASKIQVIWFGVVPQIVLPYVAFTIYRWDINVRMATVIGLVGGGGIGTMLIKYQGQAMWPQVGCIILVIAVVVWLLDAASAYIREALK